MFTRAITRKPGPNFSQGITTSDLGPTNYEMMIRQHEAYVETLLSLGLDVIQLKELTDFPDCYFVEDMSVVTPDVAIITNPGSKSRRGEENSIEQALAKYRKTIRVHPPGTVDGGDVLMVEKHVYIGLSQRTNKNGAEQLGKILEECGYTWSTIAVLGGLHLKSGVNYLYDNYLILTEAFACLDIFNRFQKIIVPEKETHAANTLFINHCVIMPKGCPMTRNRLQNLGIRIIELNVSEAQKMDGGLTCMSIRF
jgi:dimethylargininase